MGGLGRLLCLVERWLLNMWFAVISRGLVFPDLLCWMWKVLNVRWGALLEGCYWFFFSMALWGAFEMAYDAPCHPIWGDTWGFPCPHHYIVGFIGLAVIRVLRWFSFERKDGNGVHE